MEFEAPQSLAGVMKALADDAAGTVMVAGGQSLVPWLARQAQQPDYVAPRRILDLSRVAELRQWRLEGERLFLGAGLTIAGLQELGIRRYWPLLDEAIGFIGNHTIRNRATVGGCLAWADPRAELPLVALLCGAVVVTSAGNIAMADFILGPHRTALAPGAVILGLGVPLETRPCAFLELLPRRSFGRAVVSLAGLRDGDELRLAVGGLVDRPVAGQGRDWIATVAARYPALADPVFPFEYRRDMTQVLVRRLRERLGETLA